MIKVPELTPGEELILRVVVTFIGISTIVFMICVAFVVTFLIK